MNNISVVIPTIGSESLFNTIKQINSGTVVPDEILICLPFDRILNFDIGVFSNVSIIYSPKYGQVYQRILGFSKAKFDFVVQVDDDIYVDFVCIENLLNTINILGHNVAISPVFYDEFVRPENSLISNKFYQNLINPNTVFRRIVNVVLHGKSKFNHGEITSSGVNIHFDPNENKHFFSEVEWLPGGCVMHRKSNLYMVNYFPFNGKAFCEDIIHSHFLKKEKIDLYVSRNSFCTISFENDLLEHNFLYKFNHLVSEFKARYYFVSISNNSRLRLILFYFSIHIFTPFRASLNIIKSLFYGR